MKKKEITQKIIKELIYYDQESGLVFWNRRDVSWFVDAGRYSAQGLCNRFNKVYGGKQLGYRDKEGYLGAHFLGMTYKLHRVIYFYMTGEWPDCVDHINGIRDDNRWCNLRNVTNAENSRNKKRPRKKDFDLPIGITRGVVKNRNKECHYLIVSVSDKGNKIKRTFRLRKGKEEEVYAEALDFRNSIYAKLDFHENHGRILETELTNPSQ